MSPFFVTQRFLEKRGRLNPIFSACSKRHIFLVKQKKSFFSFVDYLSKVGALRRSDNSYQKEIQKATEGSF